VARLAIARGFLAEYARLDRGVQVAVRAMITQFASPGDVGQYLETPQDSWDYRIRIVQVDSLWCGVVLALQGEDTYCLITVLPSKEAYAYAGSHRFGVNRVLGVLEVYDQETIERLEASLRTGAAPEDERLYADITNADLIRLGVDPQILPLVRLLRSEADLESLQTALPEAQYTALYALACGMTVEQARSEIAQLITADAPPDQVDPYDLNFAIEHTPGELALISGRDELQGLLAHPFAAWRIFLHPSQRKIAYRPSYSGPAQVTGGPGTGKTVTALHRAAFLAARWSTIPEAGVFEVLGQGLSARISAKPVLLTTFAGNLAEVLSIQLDLLVPNSEVRSRIDVLNVDRLAYSIVKQARGNPVIADERVLRTLWAKAAADAGLMYTPAFLKNEWEQVILAQDLRTEQAYLTCLRTGRGRPLSRSQRSQVWQLTEQVTAELAASHQSTHIQLANEATGLLCQAGSPLYRHVIVDEGQDLHPAQWRLLRAAVPVGPDDLFIAADPHQRIYDNRVSLASLRINVRGRSRRLSMNYRTTQEILSWAVPLLGPDPATGLDGEVDSLLGYRSPMHGDPPQVRFATSRAQEFAFLAERVRAWLDAGIEPHAIGVAARSASVAHEAREHLQAAGIATSSLSRRASGQAVRVGTMHAMKGLEFQAVAVIGVGREEVPAPDAVVPADEDAISNAQDMQRERCVLFVACTRARDNLYVSCTGEPSRFLPACEAGSTDSSRDEAAADDDAEEPTARQVGPRTVTTPELLRLREDLWAPRLKGASLVAEADLRPDFTDQVATALGRLYGRLRDRQLEGERLLLRWPACLAASMAGTAAVRYRGGTYWPALWETTGFQGTSQDQRIWGQAFNTAIDRLGMATFPDLPKPFLGPILMHAGIPTYCLGDYFRLLLARRRIDPGMDAESFLAWATAPGRTMRLSELDVPARRFLTDGGDYALDVVDRSLDLLDRLAELDPDLDGIGLPARIVDAARMEVLEHRASRPAGERKETHRSRSQTRPRIALDPYGVGVQVILPAVGEAPDGVATWRVTADGKPVTVRSRVQWVGSAESAPATMHPLTRPVRTVDVSLVGWDHVSELEVVRPSDPVLFFADDGRRLPGQLPLPPDHVWVLHPGDRELVMVGEPRTIMEAPVAFGWEGWQLRLISLEKVRSLSLTGCPPHLVQGYTRPRLLLGGPLPGVTTPYGSPVLPEPPELWLPDTPGTLVSWYVDVRPAAGGTPHVSKEFQQSGAVDIWEGLARPVLGAFDITVRGPLGRGMRRTIFVAEGLSVSYRPAVRALRTNGLEPGSAELRAGIGAAVSPNNVRFGVSERAHVAELRAGGETEPVVITPPHVDLLCAGAGASAWTAAPIHAATEAIGELGRILVRTPGTAVRDDLQIWAGATQIQAIPASGERAPGLTGYDLTRASETVAHHGRAELFLPWGQGAMPVGFIRPRRLASGAEVIEGQLRIRDCVHVDGLSAALYLARAPWRAPVTVPIPANGVVQLPPSVRNVGPLRVLLRVEDPWTVTDWPAWPAGGSYACEAPGIPLGTDPEENALCRFLAGEADLHASPRCLSHLWKLINLASDLIILGAPADLRERCSEALYEKPGPALMALLDAELDSAACVAALIASGLATARPAIADDVPSAERLWGIVPAAAAVLSSDSLAEPAGTGDGPSPALIDAAVAQCGPDLEVILRGNRDPDARVGQFGPDAERLAVLSTEQVEAVWQAAAVVPQTLLDPDTRAVAARQMFDARRTPELARAAREATTIVRAAERLVTTSPYWSTLAQITARRHPDGKGGWLALPAMSASMALVARIAARGNDACGALERACRDRWTDLARQAPEMTSIDLVIAEALIASTESVRLVEESA
jgi:superfamily I DNA/RNA helicase